jgi:hypothetical protein
MKATTMKAREKAELAAAEAADARIKRDRAQIDVTGWALKDAEGRLIQWPYPDIYKRKSEADSQKWDESEKVVKVRLRVDLV